MNVIILSLLVGPGRVMIPVLKPHFHTVLFSEKLKGFCQDHGGSNKRGANLLMKAQPIKSEQKCDLTGELG